MQSFVILFWVLLLTFLITADTFGQKLRPGYSIPDITLSPDHRYGITVPHLAYFEYDLKKVAPLQYTVSVSDDPKNSLVEVKTGKVVGVLQAEVGWDHMGHGEVLPTRWSSDESLLLWNVSGKWCPWALVLLKIKGGAEAWQVDLLKTAQQAILTRTRKVEPQKYISAMKENTDSGSAFPDGFTVDVSAGDDTDTQVILPLKIHATLTSNCKHISAWPDNAELDAELDALVDRDGHFIVKQFRLLPRPASWD